MCRVNLARASCDSSFLVASQYVDSSFMSLQSRDVNCVGTAYLLHRYCTAIA
jgi:hypothetical protein